MKNIAAAAVLVLAASAFAALNAYRTEISLPNAVKAGDGSVLPAGKYDVQIEYKGFGNAAEFHFFQGGVLKGKTPAEARGFPSQAPAGTGNAGTVKLQKGSNEMKEVFSPDKHAPGPSDDKQKGASAVTFPKVESSGAGAQAFNWEKSGFHAGAQGKTSPAGRGTLKISFDSANSAAGFSALLPAVQK